MASMVTTSLAVSLEMDESQVVIGDAIAAFGAAQYRRYGDEQTLFQ
jgi:hypothetical protein